MLRVGWTWQVPERKAIPLPPGSICIIAEPTDVMLTGSWPRAPFQNPMSPPKPVLNFRSPAILEFQRHEQQLEKEIT